MRRHEIKVLLASPGDLKDERDATLKVLDELNKTIARNYGFFLQILRHEDAIPGIGTDPQDVVNEYLGQDFNILVGMFWSRIGKPTPRAQSGTVEEIDNAIDKSKENPTRMRVMIYFKTASVDITVDTDQLKAVQQYRKQISDEKGAFYSTFKSVDEYEQQLRMHLTNLLSDWFEQWDEQSVSLEVLSSSIEDEEDSEEESIFDEDEGLYDLIDIALDQFEKSNSATENLTKATSELSDSINLRTEEMNAETSKEKSSRKRLSRILSLSAKDMDTFVERVNTELPIHQEAFSNGMTAYSRFLDIFTTDMQLGESEKEQLKSFHSSVSTVSTSLNDAYSAISLMHESVSRLPRITKDFNRSKKRILVALQSIMDAFVQEVILAEAYMDSVELAINRSSEVE